MIQTALNSVTKAWINTEANKKTALGFQAGMSKYNYLFKFTNDISGDVKYSYPSTFQLCNTQYVDNPNFLTNTIWTYNTGQSSISGGYFNANTTAPNNSLFQQVIPSLKIGVEYEIEVSVFSHSQGDFVLSIYGNQNIGVVNGQGIFKFTFVLEDNAIFAYDSLYSTTGSIPFQGSIDSIKMKEVCTNDSPVIYPRATFFNFLHTDQVKDEEIFEGVINFKLAGYWKYEVHQIFWWIFTGQMDSSNSPSIIPSGLAQSPTTGINLGIVAIGKMYVAEEEGKEEVQYNEYVAPDKDNFIYHGN